MPVQKKINILEKIIINNFRDKDFRKVEKAEYI